MSKNNWKQFTSLPLTLTVFSPMPMPRLPDPRIPWFLGAQSFTVNLEVSPKHPPILWKLPVQSFPSYRTGFQNTSSHQVLNSRLLELSEMHFQARLHSTDFLLSSNLSRKFHCTAGYKPHSFGPLPGRLKLRLR